MRRPGGTRPDKSPKPAGYWRDRAAILLALVTVACLGSAFFLARDTRFLMPGPLMSGHGTIETCNACHTSSGSSKLGWINALFAGDPLLDSRACLTCHKMPDTAFNAHSASPEVLERSTKRLKKIGAVTPTPQWARAQTGAFPTDDMVARGLYCATCHQEHKGANFDLNKISNEQCQSCHVVKFDSFDGHHPEFESYPFKRRTPIIYDHAGHGSKHFPEVARKDPAKRIPGTCSTCHNSRADRRMMAVAPFELVCSSCHLGQITGKERVSGPKGIAFLSLPGLDLPTLKKKDAAIGEWPTASEAELTPFMKVMISRNERGRALIKTVDSLNLQDLTDASDDQIEAVTALVWEIKRLFYVLISGKASDVLADLNISCGAKLSETLVADLTASIPRDVVISAQQQWLPNLGSEMADRQDARDDTEQGCWITEVGGWTTTISESELAVVREAPGTARAGRLARASQQLDSKNAPGAVVKGLGVDPYGRLVKRPKNDAEAATAEAARVEAERAQAARAEAARAEAVKSDAPQARGAAGRTDAANAKPSKEAVSADERPRPKAADQSDDLLNLTEEELGAIKAARPEGAAVRTFTIIPSPESGRETPSANEPPPPMQAGLKDVEPEETRRKTYTRTAQALGSSPKAPDQTDDLLNPTEEEQRGTAAPSARDAEKAPQGEGAARRPAPATAKPDSAATADGTPKPADSAARPDGAVGGAANARPDRAGPTDAASSARANAPADAARASDAAAAETQAKATPVISIESNVDPESWAEYGGWYRQDFAIFYRPTGHKDKFIYSWLFLTGPQAPKGDRSPAAAVFDYLTSKDAQGSCTKCHSVDEIRGKGRLVNFSPPKIETMQNRFTNFIHEPHFGVLENRGCLTCHNLEKGRPYLQSFEQGNPKRFLSNFGFVKKELCQACHASGVARQDCLLCHKYHVNGVTTPIMNTQLPSE
jgi:hypothetical protein